ncbi:hypothetical protein N5079_32770 [Planotetraspora sp. A-T 1434]|uniref:hypothetical protein n=1 Tax=Planotetraspora sp. A-T 1434 TaxID=2979219 RepID=UPI0021BF3BDD|nr:hypothetical protein [Planotetraspora sp. A-T 1434]MCT9934988.1 hypothetical protein [Planotetraspora sp. A-T 1434]
MSDLETELRRAMSEETDGLRAAPDLVDRVVRLSRRRRSTRVSLAAAVVAVILGAGAVPAYRAIQERRQVVSATVGAVVDGIEVRDLPSGLGEPENLDVVDGRLRGKAIRWARGDSSIKVTVYRPDQSPADWTELQAWGYLKEGRLWLRRGSSGLMSPRHDDLMWIEYDGLILRVTTSGPAGADLERVAMGLRVPWDPEFDGMRVTYIPDGLRDASGKTELGPDGLSRVWTGEGGRRVRVEFVHELRAKNFTTLRQVSWPAKDMALDLRPASVRGLPAYEGKIVADDPNRDEGRVLMWLIRPGLGVRIWASTPLAGEMTRIAEGIRPVPQRYSQSVDGVEFTPLRLDRKHEKTALGHDWSVQSIHPG